VQALEKRYELARENSHRRGTQEEFALLVAAVNANSHVVVAMPTLSARTFLLDANALYANYEALVGGGIRTPATLENDIDRCVAAGKLFASFASNIRYGVLSINGVGLRNYGAVYLTLRDVAVEQRVSFLHENSYLFLKSLNAAFGGAVPQGFRSVWKNRTHLVAAKLESLLTKGSKIADWAGLLVMQGKQRSGDQCIEAHIFDSFSADAVEAIESSKDKLSRHEQTDIKYMTELLAERKKVGHRK
jgi:hypothetical protein